MAQLDVAQSGIGGPPIRFAGITCSALPVRTMARHDETYWVPPHITPSGLEQKLTNRFDDVNYYTT